MDRFKILRGIEPPPRKVSYAKFVPGQKGTIRFLDPIKSPFANIHY